jgi:hypothetical protein
MYLYSVLHRFMQAASDSQQRGERRRGREAIPHYREAIRQFDESLRAGLSGDLRQHAYVLSAECMQELAASELDCEACLPDDQQSAAVEAQVKISAAQTLEQAVQVSR